MPRGYPRGQNGPTEEQLERRTKFYKVWYGIQIRCNNSDYHSFYRYGGRGIICEWKSYDQFKKDMFESYEKHLSLFGHRNTQIDRIDNDGNYCKENCRWATRKIQCNNKSFNKSPRVARRGLSRRHNICWSA